MLSPERTLCDPGLLELLLEGNLDTDQESALVDHIEVCRECQETLQRFAGDEHWWTEAKTVYSQSDSGGACPELGRDELKHILVPSDDPEKLGRIATYEIGAVIGRGATGIVLKAFDPSLGRFVAVKVLAPELTHRGAARARFLREARAVAAVCHENIISIHAVSEFQGHPYIVMQHVPGHSLERRITEQGPCSLPKFFESRAKSREHWRSHINRGSCIVT